MIIKSCINCNFHATKLEGDEDTSHCQKENCWSRYSKCVVSKALEKFLKEDSSRPEQLSTATVDVALSA